MNYRAFVVEAGQGRGEKIVQHVSKNSVRIFAN